MTPSEPKPHSGQPGELRSFGRTRTRSLTARQQDVVARVMPRVEIDVEALTTISPVVSLFDRPHDKLWLEIGFGGGEHLIWQAKHHPDVGILGCEPFRDGVVRVLTAIDDDDLSNIRLHGNDARPLLRSLQPESIDRAFILFPDPWPKKRHAKRRLINPDLVAKKTVGTF